LKRKRLLILCGVLLLLALAALPLHGGCAPAAPAEVKIGSLAEMTGFVAMLGEQQKKGITVALEQVGYEVAGRPIKFILEDTASDPITCMDKVRKLVETDKVGLIIGPILGPNTEAVSPYLQKMMVPAITVSAISWEVAGYRSMWCQTGLLSGQTYGMGVYAYEVLGYRTISALTTDYSAGHEYMGGFIMGFEDSGGKVIQNQLVPIGTLDFTPFIVKIKDADALVTCIIGAGLVESCVQIKEQGVWERMPVIVATDAGIIDPPMLKEIGDAAVGFVSECHYHAAAPTVGNKEFVAAFTARWGYLPGSYAGMGYAATQIALDAITRTDGDMSYDVLAKALDETDMDTVRGHISFNEQRVGITEARIVRIAERVGEEFRIDTITRYITRVDVVAGEWVISVEEVPY